MKKIEFNGYDFDDPKMVKRMKYLVVFRGDLDLNGCYAFSNRRDLEKYLIESRRGQEAYCAFEISIVAPKEIKKN